MINNEPTVFEKSNIEGVKRVQTSRGLYAFLMESSSLEYEKERHCDLIQVGRWLDTKGYGIAMPISKTKQKIIDFQNNLAGNIDFQMLLTERKSTRQF